MFSVNTCQIVHQGLCFRCCILVCQVTRCREFRIIRFSQSQIVELCPAPTTYNFQFIFASIQIDSSNICFAEINMIRQRNIAHRTAIDVQLLGLCTAIGCIANVQVIHASFFNIDCQLNGFASIFHVNDFTAACTFHVFFFHRSSGNLATFKFILCFSGSGNATEKRADANSIQCHCSCQAGSKHFLFDFHLKDPPFCF